MQNNSVLPQNIDAEVAILGCILIDEATLIIIKDRLKVDDFFDKRNQIIYKACLEIDKIGNNIDITTLMSYLLSDGTLDTVGGAPYLGELANVSYSLANLESYIKLVSDASVRRKAIRSLTEMIGIGYNNEISTFDFIEKLEQTVFNLSSNRSVEAFRTIEEVSASVLENTENNSNQNQQIVGLRTGFKDLDNHTLGFQPGNLLILAARPAMGKSAMAINLATNIATKNKDGKASVAIFSLEMPAEQLVERMIAADSKLQLQEIKTGRLGSNEWIRFHTSCSRLSNMNIYFDDSTDVTVPKIRAKCRKLAAESGLDFIVIDYLQLIKGENEGRSAQEEVSRISRGLKLMAMELKIPVLALSQLSRAVEKRDDKHPIMADLRDSGSIEQDADVVMFLYRDDYYNKATSTRKGEADLIIAKNRGGSTHEGLPLLFNGACSIFEEKMNN